MAELDFSRKLALQDARSNLRRFIADAVALIRSSQQIELGLSIKVDDFKDLELEQLIGPNDPDNPKITHSYRRVSDVDRLSEITGGLRAVIAAIRNEPDLAG